MEYAPMRYRMKPINVEIMEFGKDNIQDMIDWLGSDFYALTSGRDIKIGDNNISGDKPVLVIFNSVTGNAHIAQLGNYVVRHPVKGYEIMDLNMVQALLEADKPE